MLFTSPTFIVFFALYFVCHLLTPRRYRVALIIVGSAIFYGWWKIEYAWLPFFLMAIAYSGVAWATGAASEKARKWRMAATIALLFMPLVMYKYTNFIYQNVLGAFVGDGGKLLDVPLPLGVSFVTFTLTAYVVDVCRGKFPFAHQFYSLLGYVLFFPHLIAGPILRPHELIPQLDKPRLARAASYTLGFAIFSVGVVKKIIFADQIADSIEPVFSSTENHSALAYLLAIYGFSVQIYCDFSGYTDMAIGLAIVLGIRLPNNFARPYAATSIADFWRRWHITLSHWLRDYLYIPLGGNRQGPAKQMRNLIVTMTLGGLWHGANWTFVAWGLTHGVGLSATHLLRRLPYAFAVPKWLAVFLTFHFVTLTWILFRAPNLETAGRVLLGPFSGGWDDYVGFLSANVFPLILLAVFLLFHGFDTHSRVRLATRKLPKVVTWIAIGVVWIIAATISAGSSAKFIYFDF